MDKENVKVVAGLASTLLWVLVVMQLLGLNDIMMTALRVLSNGNQKILALAPILFYFFAFSIPIALFKAVK